MKDSNVKLIKTLSTKTDISTFVNLYLKIINTETMGKFLYELCWSQIYSDTLSFEPKLTVRDIEMASSR